MDLLWIVFCLLMALLLTLAGIELNRIRESRLCTVARAAGAGTPPSMMSPSAGPAEAASTEHR